MEQKALSGLISLERTEQEAAGAEAVKQEAANYEAVEREVLLARIERLAAAYTPEWRFDRENPDAGTALALLFAEMFGGTLKRFGRIYEKHRAAFFDQLGLKERAEKPAEGYVTFGLSSDGPGGTFLKKGIRVSGCAPRETEDSGDGAPHAGAGPAEVSYATAEPLYVMPAALTSILFVDGERDYIAVKNRSGCFAPFAREEKNLQEHAFYLCQSEVLSVSGSAEISLSMEITGSGGDEAALWMQDSGACTFSYTTEDGFAEFAGRRMAGNRLTLYRAADGEAAAPRTLFGKEGCWICCRYHKPWLRPAFCVTKISLASRREGMPPDLIWNQEGEQENESFLPFGENPAPFSECCFASAEALGKPGARVVVSFWLDYEKIPFDNSYHADRRWKLMMKRADFVPDPEYDITITQVVWEYYNGTGWSRLPVEKKWETLFDGTGARAGQQVRISFCCPPDAELLSWQAAPTRYLRVRVLKMTNLYRPKGAYIVPVMSGVQISFDYEEMGKAPESAAACNNCCTQIFETPKKQAKQMVWELFCGQKETCPSLYLGFHRPLKEGPLRILFTVQEEFSGTVPFLKFSYSGAGGFAPLSVVDETENFRKSGTLTFLGREDSAQSNVCGETAYWLCIQAERGAYRTKSGRERVPRITGIFMNAAKISALPGPDGEGAGAAGNQPAGSINRLNGSYGYVNRVTNPLPVLGGCDREEEESALRRGSEALRHAGRAVTVSDFEALSREASDSVKKVKCYADCGAEGEYQPGAVGIVLLLNEFQNGGLYFHAVRTQVLRYLSKRMSGNLLASGRLFVTGPVFLEIDCHVEAVISDQSSPFEVREIIQKKAEQFLHPLNGNYDGNGWNIGTLPNETQMTNALKGIPGLRYILNLRLLAYRNTGDGRIQIPLGGRETGGRSGQGRQRAERFFVPVPGRCHVVICTE